jgi:DNA replication protein DnaC
MDPITEINRIAARHPKTPAVQRIAPAVSEAMRGLPSRSTDAQADQERLQNAERRQAEYAAAERYNAARVPLRYRQTKTHGLNERWVEKFRTACRLIEQPGAIVVLTGSHGTGKTHMACEVIRKATTRGTALYATWADISRRWREAVTGDSESERKVIAEFDTPALLVIDEIEVAKDGEFGDRNMRELLDRRYRNMRATLLLSNLSREALQAKLDPSILDRMAEAGGIVVCDWPSMRGVA